MVVVVTVVVVVVGGVLGLVGGVSSFVGNMGAEGREPFLAVEGEEEEGEGGGGRGLLTGGVLGGLSYSKTTHNNTKNCLLCCMKHSGHPWDQSKCRSRLEGWSDHFRGGFVLLYSGLPLVWPSLGPVKVS